MIHYHGTPFTPHSERLKMAGLNFCVSFAHPADAKWCMDHGQSVMWDNGAFSAYTKGKPLDVDKFYSWVEPKIGHPHWAVVPDKIDGTPAENLELIMQWPFRRDCAMPVWHMHEPICQLLKLLDMGFKGVAFGSSGPYWQVGSEQWRRRADEAFNSIHKAGPLPWVHMMRGLSLCGDRWPFASADSANVAVNHSGSQRANAFCPERAARNIDKRQCPIRWHYHETQKGFFDEEV